MDYRKEGRGFRNHHANHLCALDHYNIPIEWSGSSLPLPTHTTVFTQQHITCNARSSPAKGAVSQNRVCVIHDLQAQSWLDKAGWAVQIRREREQDWKYFDIPRSCEQCTWCKCMCVLDSSLISRKMNSLCCRWLDKPEMQYVVQALTLLWFSHTHTLGHI